jgi:hypothetical protein
MLLRDREYVAEAGSGAGLVHAYAPYSAVAVSRETAGKSHETR